MNLVIQGEEVETADLKHLAHLSRGASIERVIGAARKAGLKTLLVSGGFTYFTDRVREKLELDYAYSNVLVVEGGKLAGRVTGPLVDAQGKAAHVARLKQELGISRERVLAIG